jgi:hypothetical protein
VSDEWTWQYNPDAEHVVGGLPPEVVAEVELAEARALAAYRERQARGESAGVPQDEAFRRVFGSDADG